MIKISHQSNLQTLVVTADKMPDKSVGVLVETNKHNKKSIGHYVFRLNASLIDLSDGLDCWFINESSTFKVRLLQPEESVTLTFSNE